jgi:hypothetical protein
MPIPVLPQAMQALYLKQPMAEQPGQGKQLVLKYYVLFFLLIPIPDLQLVEAVLFLKQLMRE